MTPCARLQRQQTLRSRKFNLLLAVPRSRASEQVGEPDSVCTKTRAKQVMRRQIDRLSVLEQHKIAFKLSVLQAQLVKFLA